MIEDSCYEEAARRTGRRYKVQEYLAQYLQDAHETADIAHEIQQAVDGAIVLGSVRIQPETHLVIQTTAVRLVQTGQVGLMLVYFYQVVGRTVEWQHLPKIILRLH